MAQIKKIIVKGDPSIMNIVKRFLLFGIAVTLLLLCASCSNDNEKNIPPQTTVNVQRHPSDPSSSPSDPTLDYDTITVSLSKTTYSLSDDTEICANIVVDVEKEKAQITHFQYSNIEKYENGEWVRYHNTAYDNDKILLEKDMTLSAPLFTKLGGGWIIVHNNEAIESVAISDIDPEMTPGHYRMIVYLANNYTYYLEFDLIV